MKTNMNSYLLYLLYILRTPSYLYPHRRLHHRLDQTTCQDIKLTKTR